MMYNMDNYKIPYITKEITFENILKGKEIIKMKFLISKGKIHYVNGIK